MKRVSHKSTSLTILITFKLFKRWLCASLSAVRLAELWFFFFVNRPFVAEPRDRRERIQQSVARPRGWGKRSGREYQWRHCWRLAQLTADWNEERPPVPHPPEEQVHQASFVRAQLAGRGEQPAETGDIDAACEPQTNDASAERDDRRADWGEARESS